MRIKNNGNVGIGINNPQYKLHIGNNNAGLRIEGPATAASGGAALSVAGYGDLVVDKPGVVGGRFTIKENGNIGIGNNNPNTALSFPATLEKKITLYPGTTGDVGFAVAGNRLQIYADNPNADVAIGYDAAGTFNEKFAVKANGALAVNGNTGSVKQILVSNGSQLPANWEAASNLIQGGASPEYVNINNPLTSTTFSDFTAANYTIILTVPSRVILTYKISTFKLCQQTQIECTSKWQLRIRHNGSDVAYYTVNANSASGTSFTSGTYGPDYFDLPAGSHTFSCSGISKYNTPEVSNFRVYSTIIPL
jgi:hypothetical protein